jgi:hypothetical protein
MVTGPEAWETKVRVMGTPIRGAGYVQISLQKQRDGITIRFLV